MTTRAFPKISEVVDSKLDKNSKLLFEIKWQTSWLSEDDLKEMLPHLADDLIQNYKSKNIAKFTKVRIKGISSSLKSEVLSEDTSNLIALNPEKNSHTSSLTQQTASKVDINGLEKSEILAQQIPSINDNQNDLNETSTPSLLKRLRTTGCSNSSEKEDIYFECSVCNMTFANSEYLVRHSMRCKNNDESSIRCEICDRGFKTKSGLELHLDTIHYKKRDFGCGICGKMFGRKHILNIHMAVHYQDKKFKCEICNKLFSQKSNLHRHQRIHNSTNFGYKCRFCGQLFTQNIYLQTHIENSHIGVDIKNSQATVSE